jgi:PTS system nitrogen regulatory IIA component
VTADQPIARTAAGRTQLLTTWLQPDQILLGVEATTKTELLRTMFDVAWRSLARLGARPPDPEDVWERLLAVEASKPSGFGRGVAFPHIDCARLTVPGLCIAVPSTPIDFGSVDGVPCDLVCLLLAPEDQPSRPLNVLAMFARMSSEPDIHRRLVRERDPARFLEAIATHAEWMEQPILARDVMREPYIETFEDTPLQAVTLKMLRHDVEAIAVLSRDHEVVGQITCDEMLLLGLPEFFRQLKSVSFIRQFDPFERYFEKQRAQTAGEVMSAHFSVLEEDATLLEVVFELAVRRHPKVYVTRQGRLVGVIDRAVLLDRVLNL